MVKEQESSKRNLLVELDQPKNFLLVGIYQQLGSIQKRIEIRLTGRDFDLLKRQLLECGFGPGTEFSPIVNELIGIIYEQAAFKYLKSISNKRSDYLIDPQANGKIFRLWRQQIAPDSPRVLPDGILLKDLDGHTVISGFAEYTIRPEEKSREERDLGSQATRLVQLLNFLSLTENQQSFIDALRGNLPRRWQNKSVKFAEPDQFDIYYVLPNGRYLPDVLRSSHAIQINMPFYAHELVKVSKWIIADYFGVDAEQPSN